MRDRDPAGDWKGKKQLWQPDFRVRVVVLPLVWVMLQMLGTHRSGGVHVGPVQTTSNP
jgi:hypothetical protein